MNLMRILVSSALVAFVSLALVACSMDNDIPGTSEDEAWEESGEFGEEVSTLLGAMNLFASDSCCVPNASEAGGCNDTACMDSVCAVDPYCCGAEWDSLCVDRAASGDVGACHCTTLCITNSEGQLVPGDLNGTGDWMNILDIQCNLLMSLWELSSGSLNSLPTCMAQPFFLADLNCDGAIAVGDVIMGINTALLIPLASSIDSNGDFCPDACTFPGPDPCSLNGAKCNDANRCTENDTCSGGSCSGSTKNTNDNNKCTTDHCDSDGPPGTNLYGGVYHIDISQTCLDVYSCTDDSCDALLGCVNMPDDNKCDDGNWCTGTTVASKNSDICVAHRYDMNGNGVITADETNPVGGDDGNGCSFPDISYQCNDGLPCTNDSCNSGNGCHNDYKCAGVSNGGNSCNNSNSALGWGLSGSTNTGNIWAPGDCYISSCSNGFFDFDGVYSNGCECQQDSYDYSGSGGNSCSDARNIGTLNDNAANLVSYTGNILTGTDGNESDWYTFYAEDTADTSCDTFHVRIRFTNNPGDRFRFNVYSGSCSSEICSNTVDYEDYYDFQTITGTPACASGTEQDEFQPTGGSVLGECPCTTGKSCTSNKCLDTSTTYYVEVVRDNSAIDCSNYTIEFSNGYF